MRGEKNLGYGLNAAHILAIPTRSPHELSGKLKAGKQPYFWGKVDKIRIQRLGNV